MEHAIISHDYYYYYYHYCTFSKGVDLQNSFSFKISRSIFEKVYHTRLTVFSIRAKGKKDERNMEIRSKVPPSLPPTHPPSLPRRFYFI